MTADKKSLARNTAYSVAGFVVSFLLPIVVTPYCVAKVSMELYGVWVVLQGVVLWLSRFDLGIGQGLAMEVAGRRARGDAEGLKTLGASWFWFDLGVGALLVVGVGLGARTLLRSMVPSGHPAYFVICAIGAQAAFTPLLRHLNATLAGLQRLDQVNLVSIVITPLSVAGLVLALESGFGLAGMAFNGVLFAALQVVILAALLEKQGADPGGSPRRFRWKELAGLIRRGWMIEVNQWLHVIFRSDRLLLIARGAMPSEVAHYQFGSAVVERLGGFLGVLSSGVLPAAADLEARGDRDRLHLLLMRGTKYHALAAFGILGFAALFGRELLVLWMGESIPGAESVLRIIALSSGVLAVGSAAHGIGLAKGRSGLLLGSTAGGLGAALLLYMGMGHRYDVRGLAGSVTAGLVLSQIVFMMGLHGTLKFSWREYLGNALLRPLVVGVSPVLVWGAWRLAAIRPEFVDTRLEAAALLVPSFLLSCILCWVLARAAKVIDGYDLGVIKSLWGRPPA